MIECRFCNEKVKTPEGLEEHMKKAHPKEDKICDLILEITEEHNDWIESDELLEEFNKKLEREVLVTKTKGFINKIEPDLQTAMIEKGVNMINPNTDFLIFDPEASKGQIEDAGETVRLPSKAKDKVYAVLDDFGSAEELRKNCGFKANTQFLVTFMLADEY